MPKPVAGTYPAYYETYVNKVNENDLDSAFANQLPVINDFFDSISEESSGLAYAPGKWTLKELLQHVIDAERIFGYRCLCFARKETASLPSFDENLYAENCNANARSWKSLCDEMKTVRKSTELLFESFTEEMLQASGIANNKPVSVIAMGFIIVGHLNHHKGIIEERYLQNV